MKPITNSHLLGYIGECVVAKYFGATMSKDRYDDEKDMILPDGTFAEVKTQNRFKRVNAFTVDADKSSNLNKCLTVDKLFFVEFDWSDKIRIWDCVDRTYFITKTMYGLDRVCWPIQKMLLIHTYDNLKLAYEMRKLSKSKEFK